MIDKALSLRLGRPTNLPDYVRISLQPFYESLLIFLPSSETHLLSLARSYRNKAVNMSFRMSRSCLRILGQVQIPIHSRT